MRVSAERAAQIGVVGLFLAIVRSVAEYDRLRLVLGPGPALVAYEPFIHGVLVAAVGTFVATLLYFLRRFALSAAASVVTLIALLLYRFLVMP